MMSSGGAIGINILGNNGSGNNESLKDLPDKIFKCLMMMLENLKDKNLNKQLDLLMI
jgi:hypothetical protein